MTRSKCQQATIFTERHGLTAPLKMRTRTANVYAGREEPCLNEVIDDPIVRRLMASDGVHVDHLLEVIGAAQGRLSASLAG